MTLEEIHVRQAIIEHILSQNCRTFCMLQLVQITFEVRFLWPVEKAYFLTNQMFLRCFIEVMCQQICPSDSGRCVGRLARCLMPFTIGTDGVDMN